MTWGWGVGRAFACSHMQGRAAVTFSITCDFYVLAAESRRFASLQDAFLALPLAINGWKECARTAEAPDVSVVPRSPRRSARG